jgi:heat shock protein HslJ
MKKFFLALVIFSTAFISCDSAKSASKTAAALEGTWQLNYITGPRITFDGLYPDKKPTINFDLKENRVSGNNSCNQYFGALLLDGKKINFKDAKMGSTMMACPGTGEATYMKTLEKISNYSISEDGKTLSFIAGTIEMMRFEKVEKNAHN